MFTSNGSVPESPRLTQIYLNDTFFNFTTRAYNCALNRIIANLLCSGHEPGLRVSFCSFFPDFILFYFVYFSTDLFYRDFYCLFFSFFFFLKIVLFFLSLYTYNFIFFYCLCIVTVIVIVCHWVWTLGVWGELACHKRLFNPPPQFSRLGTWCPTLLCATVLFVSVYVWVEDEGWRVTSGFLSFLFSVASML